MTSKELEKLYSDAMYQNSGVWHCTNQICFPSLSSRGNDLEFFHLPLDLLTGKKSEAFSPTSHLFCVLGFVGVITGKSISLNSLFGQKSQVTNCSTIMLSCKRERTILLDRSCIQERHSTILFFFPYLYPLLKLANSPLPCSGTPPWGMESPLKGPLYWWAQKNNLEEKRNRALELCNLFKTQLCLVKNKVSVGGRANEDNKSRNWVCKG